MEHYIYPLLLGTTYALFLLHIHIALYSSRLPRSHRRYQDVFFRGCSQVLLLVINDDLGVMVHYESKDVLLPFLYSCIRTCHPITWKPAAVMEPLSSG